MFGKVAVLMGGNSAERDGSLQTGQVVFDALQRNGIDAEMIDTREDYISKLQGGNFARAFIALHGRGGEDGCIQGLLECLNIPYTGSKVLGSALGMDKVRSKRIWQGLGMATPPFAVWEPGTGVEDYVKLFGLPLAVKPVYEGSSIGVSKVKSATGFIEACDLAAEYGPVMIEPWITGDEYSVVILGSEALPAIQITAQENIIEYECPSPLIYAVEENLKLLATQAFKAIGACDWGRVDFIRDLNGDCWILEVNTIPSMALNGLVPIVAKVAGLSFDELVVELLSLTMDISSRVTYAKG